MNGLTNGQEYAVEWLYKALKRLAVACDGGANGWFGHSSCRNGGEEADALANANDALAYAENALKIEQESEVAE